MILFLFDNLFLKCRKLYVIYFSIVVIYFVYEFISVDLNTHLTKFNNLLYYVIHFILSNIFEMLSSI